MAAAYDFCTLFDSHYLSRALALYRSLEQHCPRFTLRAVCMDERSERLVDALALPNMRAISIREVERWDPELAAVRPTRSWAEYCWTCTAPVCRFVLHVEPEIEALTYLDADLCFYGSPAPLLDDLGDGSILLIRHTASDEDTSFGIYNVGWVGFRNDATGRDALGWWRERCIEWCYYRLEDGKLGDQKYLDDWPRRFAGVRVSTHPGAGQLAWDEGSHTLASPAPGVVLVDGLPLIFHHHAGLELHADRGSARWLARTARPYRTAAAAKPPFVWSVIGRPSHALLELVWMPYIDRLAGATDELARVDAPSGLGVTDVNLRVAASQVLRQGAPAALLRPYHRLPEALRHRVWRALSSS